MRNQVYSQRQGGTYQYIGQSVPWGATGPGKPVVCAIAFKTFTSNVGSYIYIDKTKYTSTYDRSDVAGTGTRSTSSNPLVLGNWSGAPAKGFGGAIFFSYAWDRVLSDAEILSLSDNPYQVFHQPRKLAVSTAKLPAAAIALPRINGVSRKNSSLPVVQPRINWSNPMCRDLYFAAHASNGFYSLSKTLRYRSYGEHVDGSWVLTRFGRGWKGTSSVSRISPTCVNPFDLVEGATVVMGVRVDSAPTARTIWMTPSHYSQVNGTTVNFYRVNTDWTAANANATVSGAFSHGVPAVIALRQGGWNTSSGMGAWVNGKNAPGAVLETSSGSRGVNTTGSIQIGNEWSSPFGRPL